MLRCASDFKSPGDTTRRNDSTDESHFGTYAMSRSQPTLVGRMTPRTSAHNLAYGSVFGPVRTGSRAGARSIAVTEKPGAGNVSDCLRPTTSDDQVIVSNPVTITRTLTPCAKITFRCYPASLFALEDLSPSCCDSRTYTLPNKLPVQHLSSPSTTVSMCDQTAIGRTFLWLACPKVLLFAPLSAYFTQDSFYVFAPRWLQRGG